MSKTVLLTGLICTITLASCATGSPRTTAERAADDMLAVTVEAALNADPRIYARHVDVSVDGGTVRLGGFVWCASDFLYAKSDAASVPGVVRVVNEMELMRGGMSGTSR